MNKITLQLTNSQIDYLTTLATIGIVGESREKIAEHLVANGIADLIAEDHLNRSIIDRNIVHNYDIENGRWFGDINGKTYN